MFEKTTVGVKFVMESEIAFHALLVVSTVTDRFVPWGPSSSMVIGSALFSQNLR